MRLFEVLHQHGDDDVDEDELGHEDEDNEEERREERGDAAVPQTIVPLLALFPEGVLHDPVPVVPGRDPEEGQEGHAERPEVGVLAQTLARVVFVAFCKEIV